MVAPKVFISYSHDSPEHEAAVLVLANRLRRDGIDAVLDQYETFPSCGWIQWMRDQIRAAEFVLVVCTDVYCRRWDHDEKVGEGLGATYEAQLLQQLLYDAAGLNERCVPVLLGECGKQHIPMELRRYTHFHPDTKDGYEALYRLLTNQDKVLEPVLAQRLSPREVRPDFRNIAWNVPRRNPFFTGRAEHLERIRKRLASTASAAVTQPQAVTGLGGIGKSQIAIEFAHRYRTEYSAILWTGADCHDALLVGFASWCNLLDLPQKNEPDLDTRAAAVCKWLDSNTGWLLILDNVEDLRHIRQFVTAGANGRVLITTRLCATGDHAEPVGVGKMVSEEGALFLLRRAKLIPKREPIEYACQTDRELARQISIEVDGLPLALDQAGAFIEETPSSLAEYLKLYQSEGAKLRARRGKLASSHASVTITFSLAFARVAHASPASGDLLRCSAFLAPDAIPEELFTRGGNKCSERVAKLATSPLAWVDALAEAGRFALLHRDAESKRFDIHRLVQEVIKDGMTTTTRRIWAKRVVQMLDQVFPVPSVENWPQCDRILPHARTAASLVELFQLRSTVVLRILYKTGWHLINRGQLAEAELLYRRALAIAEETIGPSHFDTASILHGLAVLYRNQHRFVEAELLYKQALAVQEKALGSDHPTTVSSLHNLGDLYYIQARYSEAESLFGQALAIREKVLGNDHPVTAASLNCLAELYRCQSRYVDAEPLYRRALAAREKALGPDHPHTASSLAGLGECCRWQGRNTEAEPLIRSALDIRERAYGLEHPEVATSLTQLAKLCRAPGRDAEAEHLFNRALAIMEKTLGPDHAANADILNGLAELRRDQERYGDAESLYRRALGIYEKAFGPDYPGTATVLCNLANLHSSEGRHAEAEPLYHRALAMYERNLGPDHHAVAQILSYLAACYCDQDRHAEAEPLYRRALAIYERVLGPKHPDTDNCRRDHAAVLQMSKTVTDEG
jgi:tetratricopeptide (TPR) repeat protein